MTGSAALGGQQLKGISTAGMSFLDSLLGAVQLRSVKGQRAPSRLVSLQNDTLPQRSKFCP